MTRQHMARAGALVILAAATWTTGAAAQTPRAWSPGIGINLNTALGREDAPWGPGVTVDLLRRSGRFAFGIEAGYQSFGTQVSRVGDFNNQPGWVYHEEFRRSWYRAAAIARIEFGTGPVRPYLIGGGGPYDGHYRDRIEVRDDNGQRVPFYDFEGSGSDVKVGATAGAGLTFARLRGGMRLALEGRWHGIFDVTEDGFGTADFLSLGLSLRW